MFNIQWTRLFFHLHQNWQLPKQGQRIKITSNRTRLTEAVNSPASQSWCGKGMCQMLMVGHQSECSTFSAAALA
jgi:hypothetical protein